MSCWVSCVNIPNIEQLPVLLKAKLRKPFPSKYHVLMITTPLNKKTTIIHENTSAKLTSQLSFAKNVATMSVKYFLVIVKTKKINYRGLLLPQKSRGT